jgi:hypothetical protein
MAGYADDYSKSNNAIETELNGIYPLTIAIKIVSKVAKVTQSKARKILLQIGTTEYHHTSKFFNGTNYYNTKRAINLILHDDPDFTDNQEAEKFNKEHEKTLEIQKHCQHEWIGKSFNWYCPKCEKHNYTFEKQSK